MPEIIQRSFTGGELSPSFRVRVDQVKFQTGVGLCQNFFPKVQGGLFSRPGFRFIEEVGDSTRQARIIPFSFNTEQTYVLVLEHLTIRFIRDGSYVESGGVPYELASPYTEDQISRVQFTQSADVMTIVHPEHPVKNLSRLAEDNWTLTDVDFTPNIVPPEWLDNETIVATIDSITKGEPVSVLTTAPHGFFTGDTVLIEGVTGDADVLNGFYWILVVTSTTRFTLTGTNLDTTGVFVGNGGTATKPSVGPAGTGSGSFEKDYSYVVTAVNEDGSESVASEVKEVTAPSLTSTFYMFLKWQAVTGADYYRIYKDPSNNTGIYGFIGETKTLEFKDYNFAPITSDAPPEARDPLTGADNRPSAVTYYQQRQIFANTNNERQSVYTTQVAEFDNMRTSSPARDTDAVTFAIAGRQVNEIRHLVALGSLLIFTSGGEWKLTEGQDQVLSPSTVGIRVQSYNGASWVTPAVVNDTVLYVQEKGSKIRDIRYSISDDSYQGNDLSIYAQHLFETYEVMEMAYSDEPYGVLWVIRDDGVLLGLTYQREHQVWAWHQHTTDGVFESVTVIGEDRRDAVYVVVRRNIEGVDRRYVERLEVRDVSSAEVAFCVDSGRSYSGTPVGAVGGLEHLEGETVVCVADGAVYEGLVVTAGIVTLPDEASEIHVGLPYTCAMETLGIDSPKATIAADAISVGKVTVIFEDTSGGFVQRISDEGVYSTAYELKPRFPSDDYNTLPLKSTTRSVVNSDGWGFSGKIRIEQRSPVPMAILAVIHSVDIGG